MDNDHLEEQQRVSVPASPVAPRSDYPSRQKGKKTVGLVIFLISLVMIGGAVFYFASLRDKDKQQEAKITPEPFIVKETKENESAEPTPASKVEEVIDKKNISIYVLNGTGITGEAAYLQNKLESLGYTDIKVGNASRQDYEETLVKFSSTLSKPVIDEITTELEKVYKEVKTQSGDAGSYDIEITTGLRIGQTPKATATPTSTSTPKLSPSPSATKTPSPSPTPIR